ncbi:MAG: DUF3160 domain-containing protein [Polyangiaceae bacterium]
MSMRTSLSGLSVLALALLLTACGGGGSSVSGGNGGSNSVGGGASVTVPQELQADLDSVTKLSAEGLAERYPSTFQDALGYAPLDARGLATVQSSSFALNAAESSAFSQRGFVISDRTKQPNFFYAYKSLYFEHLPLFVSADSVLYAVHRSYDELLLNVESKALEPTLKRLLARLRARLQSAGLDAAMRDDLALYLGVAEALLVPTSSALSDSRVAKIVAAATAANGVESIQLFGSARDEDFSQFTPRGHYLLGLESYFRAMMWLGRIDFRLVETLPDHQRVLRRRAVQATLALYDLADDQVRADLATLESVLQAFVGEADYMPFTQIQSLQQDLGVSDVSGLASLSDAQIQAVIEDKGYGAQRIASHLMVNGISGKPQPNNASFALLGQRYVIDSHVFSNVTYSRHQAPNAPLRMMPNPLDVAFAALSNNQAAQLLSPELTRYAYAGALGAMRVLVDAHPAEYWDESLYTLWLGALRQLSTGPSAAGLPSVARSEPWGRRVLNTQLASWAELRHDTLLYAKQSYTGIPSCEYPDAYVDPYPEVFDGIVRFAELGQQRLSVLQGTEFEPSFVLAYLERLSSIAGTLREMALAQRSGQPHSPEALAFINQAVSSMDVSEGCTIVQVPTGWYADLFFNRDTIQEVDPTIADVHTQPADEAGSPVGKVLHVATGNVRTMVVSIDSCDGPRAYVGPVSSYFEQVTSDFKRLNDEEWASSIAKVSPPDVPWLSPLVER